MRKFIWGCAAAAVVGGGIWAAHRGALEIEVHLDRLVAAGPPACAADPDCPPAAIPDEPVPLPAEPLALAAVLELPGSPAPAPIVIPEGDEPADAEPVAPAVFKGRPAPPSEAVPVPRMPRCDEGGPAVPLMPYAGDAEESEEPSGEGGVNNDTGWLPIEPDRGEHSRALPHGASRGMPWCEEDRRAPYHYPGCPYPDHCPYSGAYSPPPAAPVHTPTPVDSGSEELSEEPPNQPAAAPERPATPQAAGKSSIDTMEFRPGDRRLGEHGPGPL
jgi:hypothetical protein